MKKFTVKFVKEVDPELPWSFEPLQSKVVLNAGETCLIFYRARNLTDEPLIGLSVYDVHPASISFYFNKIQCFCFENQMLGPREEVDLPVFFYIDPAINDAPDLDEYREFVLKYSFYLAKKQDLAKVMSEHLKKEKEEREKLNNLKRELNKQGKNYKIEEENKFTGLPGINPELAEFIIQESEKQENFGEVMKSEDENTENQTKF
jgi:cytochrome c oxidase assembly protein subunit 11